MGLRLITPAAAEPVTVGEARAHVKMISTVHDATLTANITAARGMLDGSHGMLGRALMPQTWELVLDAFPCGAVRIPLPPLQAVTFVRYLDTAGVEQTLPTTDYAVDTVSEPGWIAAGPNGWPQTFDGINAVTIRFVAGYADAAAVPATIKAAILLLVGDLFENREGGSVGERYAQNPTVDRLLFPYTLLMP